MKKLQNINNNILSISFVLILILVWQLLSSSGLVLEFLLPSPVKVIKALVNDRNLLFYHAMSTLYEAFLGILISFVLAFVISILMDISNIFYKMFYPILLISQTIPTIAIAPLLVLWMGFGIAPKVTLIVIVCFFPLTINLLAGYKACDEDMLKLMKIMNAGIFDIYRHVKFPYAIEYFFSGLKIALSYAVVGAVIAEWLGGDRGLGIYMIRVKKSYAYDKMFAAIIVISLISIIIIKFVEKIEKKSIPWKYKK